MHRSSESVAALAAALAKAQIGLANPEKSLTATIRTGRPGEAEQSFRYAPLATGLDIVRKALGQHEIATLQTTEIDRTAGMVNLTTMLAHSSGEWIASDWPVCPIADTASPRRMGAALTYARRYALFTLVGIAGEDDLDAPDLCSASQSAATPPARSAGNGRDRAFGKTTPSALLGPTLSASLREMLLSEISAITSSALAARWAQNALPRKNSLMAADAKLVEDAFEGRLSELAESEGSTPASEQSLPADAGPVVADPVAQRVVPEDGAAPSTAHHGESTSPTPVDKSVLAIAAPRRYRNREHLRAIIKQPCLVCGRKPSDPHHLRYAQPRALGRKASDEFTVPLCRMHHREVHRAGDERAWWKATGIDPLKVAAKLWKEARVNDGRLPPNPPSNLEEQRRTVEAPGPSDPSPPV
jgi:ERF superfamily